MDPKVKRFHQILLGVCLFGVAVGLVLMFFGGEHQLLFGAALSLICGAIAGVPGFYFSSQVAYEKTEKVKMKKGREVKLAMPTKDPE